MPLDKDKVKQFTERVYELFCDIFPEGEEPFILVQLADEKSYVIFGDDCPRCALNNMEDWIEKNNLGHVEFSGDNKETRH